ncbi:TM2 domain-containing protein [Myxococcota bacterium]|nr:TM2 domain-containing protein [Myxococcota bacterium]
MRARAVDQARLAVVAAEPRHAPERRAASIDELGLGPAKPHLARLEGARAVEAEDVGRGGDLRNAARERERDDEEHGRSVKHRPDRARERRSAQSPPAGEVSARPHPWGVIALRAELRHLRVMLSIFVLASFLPLVPSLPATSTSSTAAIAASPSGVELAVHLADELVDRTLTYRRVLGAFLALDRAQREAFLAAWPRTAPTSPRAVEIFSLLKGARDSDPKHLERLLERVALDRHGGRDPRADSTRLGRPAVPNVVVLSERSPVGAWALSFFFGLGIGNFYAGAEGWGFACLAVELLGGIMAIAGFANDEPAVGAVGVVLNRGAWVADWAGAIVNTNEHNERLRARALAFSDDAPRMLTLSFAF